MKKYRNDYHYKNAKERVKELKGFYAHLVVYLIVNSIISISKLVRNLSNGETFEEAFWDMGTFVVWVCWGIGLLIHAYSVFIEDRIFGNSWEERKIAEYIEKEEIDSRTPKHYWE